MATRFTVEVMTHGVSYPELAQAYVSEEFNELVKRANRLRERALIEAELLADGRQRKRVRIVPEVQLPASLPRLLGDHTIWYDEVTIYDDAACVPRASRAARSATAVWCCASTARSKCACWDSAR